MDSFDKFYRKLMSNYKKGLKLVVKGNNKVLSGMVRFTSINYAPVEYLKLSFKDSSSLVVIPSDKQIYYSDKSIGKAKEINDNDIGKKHLSYLGEKYLLDNKDDYQIVLEVYVGLPTIDIEGECRFCDYISKDEKKVLSLGWLSHNGKRADVLAEYIIPKEIHFVS